MTAPAGAVKPPTSRVRNSKTGRVHAADWIRHHDSQDDEWAGTWTTFTPCGAVGALATSRWLEWLPGDAELTCRACLRAAGHAALKNVRILVLTW